MLSSLACLSRALIRRIPLGLLAVVLAGCVGQPPSTPEPSPLPTLAATGTPPSAQIPAPALWISPAVPDALRQASAGWGIPEVADSSAANVRLDVSSGLNENQSQWIYALVAPFPTVMDGVSLTQLRAYWQW